MLGLHYLLLRLNQIIYLEDILDRENWELNNNNDIMYKEDNTEFLFSLNNKERIKVKNSKRAIINDSNYNLFLVMEMHMKYAYLIFFYLTIFKLRIVVILEIKT